MTTTARLAELIAGTRPGSIPETALAEAKRSLLNWLGVAIGAARHPLIDIVLDLASEIGGNRQATVFGRGLKVDALNAALVNGVSSHIFDYDDTFLDTILHPSAPVAPAVLSLAEWRGGNGRAALEAFVIGVETEQRIAQVVYPSHYDRGWHITGSVGAFGAAAACCWLQGLGSHATAMALGMAATQPVGLREMFGTHTKPLHPGKAAANGLQAALLAARGVSSSTRAIEAPRGFAHVTSERPKLARLTEGWGEDWQIRSNSYKPFPCGIVIHPAIDGVVRLREQQGVSADDVVSLELHVHPLVLELTGKTTPRDGLEAKFSVFHCAAAALLDGWVGLAQFADERVNAPDVLDLRRRVSAVADPSLAEDQVRITANLTGGRGRVEVFVEHCLGSRLNPMSDAQLEHKFVDVAGAVVRGPGQLGELIATVRSFENLASVGELARLASPQAG